MLRSGGLAIGLLLMSSIGVEVTMAPPSIDQGGSLEKERRAGSGLRLFLVPLSPSCIQAQVQVSCSEFLSKMETEEILTVKSVLYYNMHTY